jgi:predicted ATP-grasp superfamily ATP-dependent carboligase
MQRTVLVLDGANRVALAVVRALVARGWRVAVGECRSRIRRGPAAFFARGVARRYILPDLADEAAFIGAVARLAREADVLVPVATNTLLALSGRAERWPVAFPFAPREVLRAANRKDWLLDRARQWGVPVPQTWVFSSPCEVERRAPALRYPVVVKFRHDEGLFLAPEERYRVAHNPAELVAAYRALDAVQERPLVQEYVAGDGFGVSAVCHDGIPLAIVAHRRLREYPPGGGPSTACESVLDLRLENLARTIWQRLRWTGPAMIEFRRSRATGEYLLMEMNPRFWGSVPLAIDCGVNFPDILCRMALGDPPPPTGGYRVGRRIQFRLLDAAALLRAAGTPFGGAYASGFLRDLLRAPRDGIWDGRDLRGSLRALWGLLP